MWLVIGAHIWFLSAVIDPRTDLVWRLGPMIALVCLTAGLALAWRLARRITHDRRANRASAPQLLAAWPSRFV